MADRLFSSLVTRVNPYVPGCPQPTITQFVREAAIRACERTLFWRYQIPLFNLLPGVHEYDYDVPANTDVQGMFAVHVNDQPLDLLTLEQALHAYPKWADLYSGEDPAILWSETPSGAFNEQEYNEGLFNQNSEYVLPEAVVADASQPMSVCQLTPDKYIVLPLPDNERIYTVRMFVALKPKRNATGMAEKVFNELEDVIVHGSLQHLLTIPGTNWSDKDLAAYHAKQYLFHLTERRARANLGNMRGVMTARMQPFS